jgi:xanthine/CO dehydrogenase XdhC/CoxF family maturation factor
MATLRAIVDALESAAEHGESVVLATVVRITGSSYGGVGTRMVIRVDGSTIGIVSGGCLETDLAEHARMVHESSQAKLVTYDTRADDDAAWGLGLGCNGLIDVFLEPLVGSCAGRFAGMLRKANDSPVTSVLATVISSDTSSMVGVHALVTGDDTTTIGDWGSSKILEHVRATAPSAMKERRRGVVAEFDGVTVAFEAITPAIRLVICGSGPDVVPLVRFAGDLGWNVTVIDHRPVTDDHAARFPLARVIECLDASDVVKAASVNAQTAAVVMSHHYARDLEYVRALLGSDARYIGVLGPRARSERMLADMSATGDNIERGERLHSPIGLNIGGDGPDGIALSIVAEVSAVMTGSEVKHLRDHAGALHPVSQTH